MDGLGPFWQPAFTASPHLLFTKHVTNNIRFEDRAPLPAAILRSFLKFPHLPLFPNLLITYSALQKYSDPLDFFNVIVLQSGIKIDLSFFCQQSTKK